MAAGMFGVEIELGDSMKKLAAAAAALAIGAVSASAADMAPKTFTKAPLAVPVTVYNWTGCYVGGGGGGGMWNQENGWFVDAPPRTQVRETLTTGGRGYFGTVQGGCDYQFAAAGANFVIGAFGDYDFGSLKGRHTFDAVSVADEKMSSAWSVGGRAGWLALPGLLTYFSAGYTEATFDRQNYVSIFPFFGVPQPLYTDKQRYKGWFVGAGDEYALSFLPGLFWKTEYRFSEFDRQTNPFILTTTGLPNGASEDSKKWVHTVRSEFVYRFNWGGSAPRTYVKAPPPPVAAANWTGCYVGGGGGYGLWNQENIAFLDGPPRAKIIDTATTGGRGYFGTVQGGCDYQFAAAGANFVMGAFGDYDFGSLEGRHANTTFGLIADEKMSSAWSVGGRAGWLAFPSLLTYFSAGYTQATFDQQNYTNDIGAPFGVLTGVFTPNRTYKGWFVGAGDEYALNFLPGLFWKTEYRFSTFGTETNPYSGVFIGLGPIGASDDSKVWVHTVRSALVYRFNWGGPIAAKY
jgi:hypothetical protein